MITPFFHFFSIQTSVRKNPSSEFNFYQGIWVERQVRYDFMKTFMEPIIIRSKLKINAEWKYFLTLFYRNFKMAFKFFFLN